MANTTTVQVSGLQRDFGQVQALKGVGLAVESGQIFGLLGPNGAGKTTLIRLLIGALKPSAGQMTVMGFDPVTQKRALRQIIGYMPQEPALYDDLSPRANIRFFGLAHGIGDLPRRIDKSLDFVGLSERARDPVYTLSGGMKQRVSLACALVHEPRILFLDEPTSGIDPQLRETFWQHFRKLATEGVTILVSTHQMDEAMHCDTLAILQQGEVLACDTPRRLLWNSRARIRVWEADRMFEEEVTDLPGQLPAVLQRYGLDPAVNRIEIEEDTLETIVLRMIAEQKEEPLEQGV